MNQKNGVDVPYGLVNVWVLVPLRIVSQPINDSIGRPEAIPHPCFLDLSQTFVGKINLGLSLCLKTIKCASSLYRLLFSPLESQFGAPHFHTNPSIPGVKWKTMVPLYRIPTMNAKLFRVAGWTPSLCRCFHPPSLAERRQNHGLQPLFGQAKERSFIRSSLTGEGEAHRFNDFDPPKIWQMIWFQPTQYVYIYMYMYIYICALYTVEYIW